MIQHAHDPSLLDEPGFKSTPPRPAREAPVRVFAVGKSNGSLAAVVERGTSAGQHSLKTGPRIETSRLTNSLKHLLDVLRCLGRHLKEQQTFLIGELLRFLR